MRSDKYNQTVGHVIESKILHIKRYQQSVDLKQNFALFSVYVLFSFKNPAFWSSLFLGSLDK